MNNKKKIYGLTASLFLISLVLMAFGKNTKEKETSTSSTITTIQSIKKRGKLRVGVKVDVPGFGYQDPDTKQLEGMEIDIAKEISKRIFGTKNKIEFTGVTAKTRGPLVDNGEVDMVIATFTITEERKKSYHFTTPYYTDEVGFLVRKEDHFSDLNSLNQKRIGVTQNATTKFAIEQKGKENGLHFNFLEYGPYPMMKLALSAKRIDAFSVDKSILLGYLDDKTEILPIGFAKQEYGITSKKTNHALAEQLNHWVEEMKVDGTLHKIQAKWNIHDTSDKEDM